MKKNYKVFILIFLGVYILSAFCYSQDWYNGEFINSINSSDFDYYDLSNEADFWHYSGGYWQTNYYGNELKIYDFEMSDYLKSDDSKLKIQPISIKIEIPEKFNLYLLNGGSIENIKFSLESDYLSSRFKPDEIFEEQKIRYRIEDDDIEINFIPLFNIITKTNIQPTNGVLNISIPTINPKFGFPLFSIWNKDGTSLGNTNIGNIADIPEGHVFLDGRNSVISIDTSSDIINPQGDLVSKDIGIWNTVPSKYTITEKSTNDHRIGVGTFANGGAAGMKFILPLRMYYPVLEEDIAEEEITDPVENIDSSDEHSESFDGSGAIKAMAPNSSKFDVSLGIPCSEEVYTQVIGKSRLTNYAFEKVTGNKDFSVTVKRKYIEKWKVVDEENSTEDETVYINKSRSETVSKNYTVNRDYSYYKINYFENYGIDSATVTSDILPGGQVTLMPNNYTEPTIDLVDEVNIVSEPSVNAIVNLSDKIVGKNETPASPNWSSTADNAVGSYQVRNDSLVFDSQVIMDSSTYINNAPAPKDIVEAALIHEDVLRKENLKIGDTKRNGTYPSTGEILYKKTFDYHGTSLMNIVENVTINSVKVHTPIYSELLISSIGDDYNQQINADIDDRAIILGMPTKFRYQTTGNHRNILGYGNRDYDQYILEKEIKFPFDLYYNTTSREHSKFVEKNTWITVDALDTDIYVPIWVDEGSYTIQIRSKAINSLDLDTSSTAVKNTNDDYYIVEDEKVVEVIGRLYGFKVRDINDYPIWEEVFRKATNSYEFIKGNNYPFGGRDENENVLRTNTKFFLPIAPGSHPTFSNAGSIPFGYKIRFTVETIGNYLKDDQVLIKPSFSFIDYEGNKKENIKVWSKVRVNNKDYLIDLSSIDSTLKDQIAYSIDLGDPYITLEEESFIDTSDFLGISLFDLKKRVETIGYADGVNLTKYLRSYIGDTSNKPDPVNESKIKQSRQKWYGEYWLPNDTYVLKDDLDLIAYANENNGIDFSEEIFMKDGYLKVNFNIETEKDPSSVGENLAYRNAQSNMYQIEGFNNEKEIMINGINKILSLDAGDVIFYDVNRKRSDDYDSFGTH
jgi:hypothetical protein